MVVIYLAMQLKNMISNHTSVGTDVWFDRVLGIGYDMGIYSIPIPKILNSYGYLPNTHTQILNFFSFYKLITKLFL